MSVIHIGPKHTRKQQTITAIIFAAFFLFVCFLAESVTTSFSDIAVGKRCPNAAIDGEECLNQIPPQDIISVEGGLFSLSSIEGKNSFAGRPSFIIFRCILAAFRAETVIRQ